MWSMVTKNIKYIINNEDNNVLCQSAIRVNFVALSIRRETTKKVNKLQFFTIVFVI